MPNGENLKIHEASPYNENWRQEYQNCVEETYSKDMVKFCNIIHNNIGQFIIIHNCPLHVHYFLVESYTGK